MSISEPQLQAAIIDCAQRLGWLVAHFRPARVTIDGEETYRTPVAANGKGWPDLTLVRGGRLIFAELKSADGKVSSEQAVWLAALLCVSTAVAYARGFVPNGMDRMTSMPEVLAVVWRPEDWRTGEIERVLRG